MILSNPWRLAPELGGPDLLSEAYKAAVSARRIGLAAIMDVIGRVHRAVAENRLPALVDLAQALPRHKDDIEPWLQVELGIRSKAWIEELESALLNGHNAALLIQLLPPFYEVVDAPDRLARKQRLQQIQLLIKDKLFRPALAALHVLPERQPKQEAVCVAIRTSHEGLGDFRSAAECHLAAGNLKEALTSYRSIPDLEASLKLLGEISEHPAAESLQWISRLQQLVAERPEKFTKAVTSAAKKLLEELLERALGVSRRKPVPRSTAKKTLCSPKASSKEKGRSWSHISKRSVGR